MWCRKATVLRGGNCYVQADGYTHTITGRRRKEEASGSPPRGFLPAFQNYTPVKAANAMTEALNAHQLTVLRRAAAAGHVSIMTAEERPALDELLERKGNSFSETNSLNLDGGSSNAPENRWRA